MSEPTVHPNLFRYLVSIPRLWQSNNLARVNIRYIWIFVAISFCWSLLFQLLMSQVYNRLNFANVYTHVGLQFFWYLNNLLFVYLLLFLLIRKIFQKGFLERPDLRASLLTHKEWTDGLLIPSVIYIIVTTILQYLIPTLLYTHYTVSNLPQTEWFGFITSMLIMNLSQYVFPFFLHSALVFLTILLVSHPRFSKHALGIHVFISILALVLGFATTSFQSFLHKIMLSLFQEWLLSGSDGIQLISGTANQIFVDSISNLPSILIGLFGWRWLAKNWSHREWRVE